MKTKYILLVSTCLTLLGLGFVFFQNKKATAPSKNFPAPTNGPVYRTDQSEDEDGQARREAWVEMLHKAAPGTDWRQIDRQNLRVLRELRPPAGDRAIEYFADSTLMGEWSERGSLNQAGSLRKVDYHAPTDKIYAISDGGSIWRGGTNNEGWEVLNDDRRFNPVLIKVQPTANADAVRIIAAEGKILHFSDDEALTWQAANFSPDFYDGWGTPIELVSLASEPNTLYYLVQTWDNVPWAGRVWLYRSTDNGANFTRIKAFNHGEADQISLWRPLESDLAFILDRGQKLYQVQADSVPLLHDVATLPTNTKLKLTGSISGGQPVFYALAENTNVFKSTDGGQIWELQGSTPDDAWEVGMICSPFNPDQLVMGAVNSQRSNNGGSTWELLNEWYEYYGNIDLLHADIMDLKAFKKTDGTPFFLIANHGGLHISYDDLETTQNIGRSGLNISQYYDVVSNPAHPEYFYAGTQDQGWQWTNNADLPGALNFVQQWSGDYGMMQLTNNYNSLWVQYPGGDFSFYVDALNLPQPWGDSNWNLPEGDVPALDWIVPTAPTAYPNGNSIFVAGGNVNEGGDGSHLITLSASTAPPYEITADQFNYDFKEKSKTGNGLISAIEQSEADPSRLFVTTDDGTFFRSVDDGSTWQKTAGFTAPTVDYIYTACILASKLDPNLVWVSGSGYSNPAVFKSLNGGQTFVQMSNGLPQTLVQEIVANPDETLLFAATAVGPYVYVVAKNEWFPMIGAQTPLQWYTCVEYLDNPSGDDIVRFGTFGRGVWDFRVSQLPPSATNGVANVFSAKIYPNPAPRGAVVRAEITAPTDCDFELVDVKGRVVARQAGNNLELGKLPGGVYLYRFSRKGKTLANGKLVVQ